jgi:uncharacterized protein YcbK (DUF882 family)
MNGKLEGAVLNSQHIRGMALDVHIPGVDNDLVARDVASFAETKYPSTTDAE